MHQSTIDHYVKQTDDMIAKAGLMLKSLKETIAATDKTLGQVQVRQVEVRTTNSRKYRDSAVRQVKGK